MVVWLAIHEENAVCEIRKRPPGRRSASSSPRSTQRSTVRGDAEVFGDGADREPGAAHSSRAFLKARHAASPLVSRASAGFWWRSSAHTETRRSGWSRPLATRHTPRTSSIRLALVTDAG